MIHLSNLTSRSGESGAEYRLLFAVFIMVGEGSVYHFADGVVQMHRFQHLYYDEMQIPRVI